MPSFPSYNDESASPTSIITSSAPASSGALPVTSWRGEGFAVPIKTRRIASALRCRRLRASGLFLLMLIGLATVWSVRSRAVEVVPEYWRWSNPLPHGNNVMDMLGAGELAAQVGDGGTVYVQRTDERWSPAVTGVTNYLRGVALLGERFLVVGENGCMLWSDDGKVFQRAALSPATSDWFEGVAASPQKAVAAGDYGSLYTSTNGTSWTKTPSVTDEWLRGVAFGNGVFVAVGENGMVLRSPNGSSWSRVVSGTTAHLNRVRYLTNASGGQFVAVGNHGVALSSPTGGTDWTALSTGTTNNLYDVARNDTGTLLIGDQELRFQGTGTSTWINHITAPISNAPPAWTYLSGYGSADSFQVAGRTGLLVGGSRPNDVSEFSWQMLPESSSHAWLWDLMVQQGTYVAVGDLATILTSLDGILWAGEVVPESYTNTVLLGVGGTTNLLLAVGNAGAVLVSYAGLTNLSVTNYVGTNLVVTNTTFDTLGLVWTDVPAFTTNNLQGVAAGHDRYVVTGDAGSLFSSPNGSNWTTQVTPTTSFLSGVAAFPGGWVAVGDRGALLRSGPEATSWTSVSLGTANWLYRVRWVGEKLVAVGQNGSIYTSVDGTVWTPRSSGTTIWLTDVTFLDGTWFVVGNQGLLLSSTNLVNWSPLPLPTIKSLFGAAASDGQLVAAGIEGVVLRNRVVPARTPVNFLDYRLVITTNQVGAAGNAEPQLTAYELFLLGGEPDQHFAFQSSTNLNDANWTTNAALELYDASGTLYLIRTRPLSDTPPAEFYRTELLR